ncbi:hypothetical protein P3X46_022747 [Hevea brasiliensis]|uniref:Leucine-rich repeat-containing N-terminal plant-type domain-containing protein n=1 Tax=Hevea brasiliensis TaxID=3981 RepID=A0ABQ9L8S5_HEVBR|nr:cuscuta receptor 1 [Hevea brasiliensis]KAJ9163025.1 hypothetical protein P3X46_022747 [Hevea brasiliensis]
MGLNQLWMSLMMVLLLHGKWWCDGCWDDERIALLKLKAYFSNSNRGSMSSWGGIPNCCNWEYVECSPITGRVSSLYLGINSSRYPWTDPTMADWHLNTSLFLPFKELKRLSLNDINIAGCVENEGFERLWSLGNLEFLDLSFNRFNNSILPSLSGLSPLKSLILVDNRLKGIINIQELNNLTSLKELNLQGNEIEGFKSSNGLRNLELLDLSDNHLDNSKLSHLKGLSSLKSLNMGYNSLTGTLSMKEFDGLSNLEELDLSGNKIIHFEALRDARGLSKLSKLILDSIFSYGGNSSLRNTSLLHSLGAFPYLKTLSLQNNCLKSIISAQGLPNFKKLEHLYMNYSTASNNFLQIISNMTSLKTLSLYGSGLRGTLFQGICKLEHLQVLDIGYNDLNGSLPWCLANLTSLQQLNLSSNLFTGNISPLEGLRSIQELELSHNHFEIPISLGPVFNHTRLLQFHAEGNEVYADIEVHNLIPKFQLETLVLSGLGYGGAFPKFLYYQKNLQVVDISYITMKGGFPFWLLENNTNLEMLYLANNSLSGPLQLPIHSHMGLSNLDISNNSFHGHVPMGMGISFPMLQVLKMSRNGFTGNIPSSLGNASFLKILQLDGNQLTGSIPNNLYKCSYLGTLDVSDNHLSSRIPGSMGNMSSLEVLDLSKNNIFGSFPPNFNPSELVFVYLSENRLQGSIRNSFYGCSKLITLDLSHNSLTGTIPEWIGRLSFLSYLSLSYNSLEGEIPNQLCNLGFLNLIDLSHNNLSGPIVPCLRVNEGSGVIDPRIESEQMKWITYSFLLSLSRVDLSHNKLSGEIPPEIGDSTIKVLNLSHNSLTGPIPSTFSKLSEIRSLDLSYNHLDGKIPPELTQLYLFAFSVAHNNLSGPTPANFLTFDESSYEGNPLLCGPPLPKSCDATTISTDVREESGFIDKGVFYVSFLVTYIMVLLAIVAVFYINPYWRRAWFTFIEVKIINCQYFLEDNFYVLFKFRVP